MKRRRMQIGMRRLLVMFEPAHSWLPFLAYHVIMIPYNSRQLNLFVSETAVPPSTSSVTAFVFMSHTMLEYV